MFSVEGAVWQHEDISKVRDFLAGKGAIYSNAKLRQAGELNDLPNDSVWERLTAGVERLDVEGVVMLWKQSPQTSSSHDKTALRTSHICQVMARMERTMPLEA
jgi:hypothetical protein